MHTYSVHAFDTDKPALYVDRLDDVRAGNVGVARNKVARIVGGRVDGVVVVGPNGLSYDVFKSVMGG